jgi:hypothetical protein
MPAVVVLLRIGQCHTDLGCRERERETVQGNKLALQHSGHFIALTVFTELI